MTIVALMNAINEYNAENPCLRRGQAAMDYISNEYGASFCNSIGVDCWCNNKETEAFIAKALDAINNGVFNAPMYY